MQITVEIANSWKRYQTPISDPTNTSWEQLKNSWSTSPLQSWLAHPETRFFCPQLRWIAKVNDVTQDDWLRLKTHFQHLMENKSYSSLDPEGLIYVLPVEFGVGVNGRECIPAHMKLGFEGETTRIWFLHTEDKNRGYWGQIKKDIEEAQKMKAAVPTLHKGPGGLWTNLRFFTGDGAPIPEGFIDKFIEQATDSGLSGLSSGKLLHLIVREATAEEMTPMERAQHQAFFARQVGSTPTTVVTPPGSFLYPDEVKQAKLSASFSLSSSSSSFSSSSSHSSAVSSFGSSNSSVKSTATSGAKGNQGKIVETRPRQSDPNQTVTYVALGLLGAAIIGGVVALCICFKKDKHCHTPTSTTTTTSSVAENEQPVSPETELGAIAMQYEADLDEQVFASEEEEYPYLEDDIKQSLPGSQGTLFFPSSNSFSSSGSSSSISSSSSSSSSTCPQGKKC